jgi:single-stranded-DNA-specific exonuclease
MSWYKKLNQNVKSAIGLDKQDYFTKVVGVTYENRQQIIRRLRPGQEIKLVREPHNQHDRNAIAVRLNTGEQIGYIRKEMARDLAPRLDRLGHSVTGVINHITGGEFGKSYGVNISFTLE